MFIWALDLVLYQFFTVTKQIFPHLFLPFGNLFIYIFTLPNDPNRRNYIVILPPALFSYDPQNITLLTPYFYKLENYIALLLNKSMNQYEVITNPILQSPQYLKHSISPPVALVIIYLYRKSKAVVSYILPIPVIQIY